MTTKNQNQDEEKELIKLQIKVQEAILRKENRKEKLYINLRKSFLLLLGVGLIYLLWYTIFKEFILTELPMQYLDIHGDWMVETKIFPYSSETVISSLPTPYKIGFYVLPIMISLCVVGFFEIIKVIFRILLLVAKAIKRVSTKLFYIYKLHTDRIFVLDAITKDRYAFIKYAHKKFNNDRVIVLAALEQDGSALEYASKSLQNDKEVVLAALVIRKIDEPDVGQIQSAFKYASPSLQNDKEFVLKVVKLQPNALEFVSEDLKNDPEVVTLAVNSTYENGMTIGKPALAFASKELQNDRKIVLDAVRNPTIYFLKYYSLEYASTALQSDREIVLAAVRNHGHAIEFASKEFHNDKEIVSEAVMNSYRAIKWASKNIQDDKLFIQTHIDKYRAKLAYLSNEKGDKMWSPLQYAQWAIEYLESQEWLK